jgi:energy-coupling factor transport system permease protein
MTRSIFFGQYVPGSSALHRMLATTKLLAALAFGIATLIAVSWREQGLLACVMVVGLVAARLPFAALARGLRSVVGWLAAAWLLNAAFTPGSPLWRLGPLVLSRPGVNDGGLMTLRLLLLVLAGSLVTLTTNPIDLTDGVEALLGPFRPIGVPAHELAMMMTIALRFIPTLVEEAERIARAQAARGGGFDSPEWQTRLRSLPGLLVPLFTSSFRRADDLAVAMECRCYRGGTGRTHRRQRHGSWIDAAGAGVALAAVVWVGWLRWRGI